MQKQVQAILRCVVVFVSLMAGFSPLSAAVNVLFVTANNGSLTALESGRKSQIEGWGFTVNTIWAGASQATFNAAFATNRAVYLPDEASEANVGYKLREATIGVFSEHPGLADELGLCNSTASTTTSSTVTVTNNSHYVTSVFSAGSFSLGSGTYHVVRMGGTTAPGAQVLATVGGVDSIVAVETGATLANTYNSSNVAFGRRVQFPLPISVNDGSTFSANTFTLASRMLWWAAGFDRALILYWKLDETSGTSAADDTGFGSTGTYTGGPTLGATAPHRFGAFFPTDNIYVTTPANMLLNSLGTSNADFSVAFWVKPNASTGGWRPLLHKGGADFDRGPGLWLNPDSNRVHFRVSTNADNNEGTNSNADLPYGVWSHIACVKSGNKWRCYINGVLDTELTLSGATIGNNGPLYFGDDPWYGGSNTYLDDLRIFTGALTDTDVKNLFGTVGHWKLDETSGTTAADSSIALNAGTYTNGPVLNQPGVRGTAVTFDGTDDYISVPNNNSLKATDSVSIAAWVCPTASTNVDRMIVNKEGEFELAISDTNEIKWALANTSPGWGWHKTGKFAPNGAWSHIVVTYDGAEVKTYLNAQLVETFAASGNIGDVSPSMNELRIGGCSNSPSGKYFAGGIDDVYVFTRTLSASEVADMCGLVGYWKFAEGSGPTAADTSGNGNNATLSGGAAWESNCAGDIALQTNGAGGIAQTVAAFQPPSVGTICFWMRGAGAPAGTARVMGLGGDWEIRQSPNGTLSFDLGGSPYVGNELFNTLDPVSTAGRWYHIAAVFDDTDNSYSVYIDGTLRTSGISPVDLVPQAPGILSFGTRTGTTDYWNGALRDVRIYSRKLAATEIAALSGMIGYWKFDETSGSIASDSSGAGNDGTYTGGPTLGAAAPHNLGVYFQSNGKYMIASASTTLTALGVNNADFSVAFWVKPAALTGDWRPLMHKGSADNERGPGLWLNQGNNRVHFRVGTTANWNEGTDSVADLTMGAWSHIACVKAGNKWRCYINGALDTEYTLSAGTTGNSGPLYVGDDPWFGGSNSYMDDLRAYNRALCPAEILAIYGGSPFQGVRITKWVEIQ